MCVGMPATAVTLRPVPASRGQIPSAPCHVAQASRLCAITSETLVLRKRRSDSMAGEIYTRRNLPHWYMPSATHFVTFRLADTLPKHVLADLRERKAELLRKNSREVAHKQLFAAYDEYLDRNREGHWLDHPQVAALVRRSLDHSNGGKYGLCADC